MRKGVILVLMLVGFLSCKAQSPVLSIDSLGWKNTANAYYKDLNNELDKFVGTCLTIVLQKLELFYNGKFYEDILIGEYKYIENGVEIVNFLPLLDANSGILAHGHKISGRQIIPNDMYVGCDDCQNDERRVRLSFNDPERLYLSTSIILRYHLDEDSLEKMTDSYGKYRW